MAAAKEGDMVIHPITAIYENGVLRPTTPLTLAEGTEVRIHVVAPSPPMVDDPNLPESARRIRAAKTWEEFIAAAEAASETEPDDGYDLLEALNENRRAECRMPVYPPEEKGITW
jgi:predicted DNA-binding antitoxin AbrB/MazE fold protein